MSPASAPPAEGKPKPVGIPDHELLRCIGRGSYGEVWLARSVLGLLRAVKVVYRDRFADGRPYEREFTGILRAEPLSRAHDGLVDILHVGRREPEGYFYYIMELADDAEAHPITLSPGPIVAANYEPLTLARELKHRGKLRFDQCVQLGLNLSGALSQLHQSGLVHRDVKPSNILYVGGIPKLGDIGLVGEVGGSASYVGTEGYVPPEGPGSPQADVFGLGKVLYEAATGEDRLAFPKVSAACIDEPGGGLAELNEIFLRACAPDPRERYQTAEDLHSDLALLHRGQSLRRQRKAERKWHRLSLVGYVGAALAGFAAGAVWSPIVRDAATRMDSTESNAVLRKQSALDLAKFFNATLTNNWFHDFVGNDLSGVPTGWHRFGRAYFDVRGVIQLSGGYTEERQLEFPGSVEGILVGRKCTRLHFLHGTGWWTEKSRHVAAYVVHYFDGRQEEIPVRYGEEVNNWWWQGDPVHVDHATLAWIGTNGFAGIKDKSAKVRLYSITWNNPFPDEVITKLDFVSTRSPSSPFLLAITVE